MSSERVLESYRKMLLAIKNQNIKMKKLEEEKIVSFKDKKYFLKKGTMVLDCEDEFLARVLYMNDIVNVEFLKKEISTSEIRKIIEEVENVK